jgi:hypothetical protein
VRVVIEPIAAHQFVREQDTALSELCCPNAAPAIDVHAVPSHRWMVALYGAPSGDDGALAPAARHDVALVQAMPRR